MELKLCITYPPVTKKNHQQIRKNFKTGKPFIAQSDQYRQYENAALWLLRNKVQKPITTPVEVRALFYMPTKRRVDLTNPLEAVDDVLVKANILADDNCGIIASHDGSRVLYDKQNPRTEILIREFVEEA